MDLGIRSAFAAQPHHSVSDKYQFIPTTTILDMLQGQGWYPVKASESRVARNSDKDGYQKHMIRLRQVNPQSIVLRDTVFPEVVVVNSHSTSASFWFMMGLFRLVCSNGMVVADSMLGEVRVRHVGYEASHALDAIGTVINGFPAVTEKVKMFSEIELTPDERGVYAAAAAQLRWDNTNNVDVKQLAYPRRTEDRAPTLWHTFQTVQENLTNGGRFMYGRRGQMSMRRNRAVKIKGIDSNLKINKALWTLTEEMARLKGASIEVGTAPAVIENN